MILRFRRDVAEIAQEIANRAGSKLVLVSNYETIWFDPTADITDEVIAVMRARGTSQAKLQNAPSEGSGAIEDK